MMSRFCPVPLFLQQKRLFYERRRRGAVTLPV